MRGSMRPRAEGVKRSRRCVCPGTDDRHYLVKADVEGLPMLANEDEDLFEMAHLFPETTGLPYDGVGQP